MTVHTKRKQVDLRHVIRKFRQGVSYPQIAKAHGISEHQVRTMIERWTEREASGIKPVSQDSIGLHFKTVPPYRCKGCRTRTGVVPVKQTIKPCVLCAAELAK